MSRPRRYAEGTSVPVGKTKDELDRLLTRAGASQTVMGADRSRKRILIGFSLDGRQYRLYAATAGRGPRSAPEQVEREAWRALLLIVKAKLEVARSGYSSIESEFLGNIVLPNGQTVAEDVLPKIAEAYESGHMPLLLPG